MMIKEQTICWINDVNNIFVQTDGYFNTQNSSGVDFVIEWEKIEANSMKLNEKVRTMSHLLVNAYSNIEIEFARKYPDLVKDEMFLKSLAPLFEKGVSNVDWFAAQNQIKEVLNHFFLETDWTQFSKIEDIHIFALIKDKNSSQVLGLAQFLITSEYEYGTIKVALYDGVNPSTHPEINKLLLSSIFKLIPNVNRLFLHTRITNETAIIAHQQLGFTKFQGPLQYWQDLEYCADKNDLLQMIAESLKSPLLHAFCGGEG